MKVLLVNPNSYCFRGTLCPPLAVMQVAALTREAGHEVKIIDRNIQSFFKSKLVRFNPDVVGVSVFTGPLIKDALYVSRIVKKVYGGKVPVVWGGIHPTILPEQVLENEYIDYIIQGEEFAFVEFLKEFGSNNQYDKIRGLGYKNNNGTVQVNEKQELCKELDTLPPIPWDMVKYMEYFRIEVVLVTSRGCPFNCKFCYNKKVHDRKWRAMSAERVLEEIHRIEKLTKTRILKFHDDNFAVNEKRLQKILDGLSSDYTLYLEMRTNRISREILETLKRFKRVWFFFGIESGSQRLLDHMSKGVNLKDHINAMKLIDEYDNFCVSGNAIVGLPGETPQEFEETVNFVNGLKMTWPNISLFCPYPGSEYYEEVVRLGKIKFPQKLEQWAEWSFFFSSQIQNWFEWDFINIKGADYLKKLNKKHFWQAFSRMIKKGEFSKMSRRFRDYRPFLTSLLNRLEKLMYP
ncbi:MAG: radical SAM protein [bacterium]